MTSGIQRMDIAHKAFISSAAGGPGGLAGAFEIDAALMKGGEALAGVLGKVMTAMEQQFGGPAITPEDVVRTPALAGELMKQVAYLRDVAGIASTDVEAYNILGAMQRGAPDELQRVMEQQRQTPEEAMSKAMSRSESIQERQMTTLDVMANYLERLTMLAGMTNWATLRELGASVPEDDVGKMMDDAGTFLQGVMSGARETTLETYTSDSIEEGKDKITKVFGRIMGMGRGMAQRIGGEREELPETAEMIDEQEGVENVPEWLRRALAPTGEPIEPPVGPLAAQVPVPIVPGEVAAAAAPTAPRTNAQLAGTAFRPVTPATAAEQQLGLATTIEFTAPLKVDLMIGEERIASKMEEVAGKVTSKKMDDAEGGKAQKLGSGLEPA
jgi:hypothetical protein